jgi:HNH endonuclease
MTQPTVLESPCIEWTKFRLRGYGLQKFRGKTRLAHRVAWMLANGEIPDGLCVLHRCDNPPCVNVDHLFLGTHADNVADKMAKGRHPSQRK